MKPVFLRRLGSDQRPSCEKTASCPDILALEGGDFAVIGKDITAESAGRLPPNVGCGPDERVVLIPRRTLVLARPDIPSSV